MRNVLAIIGRWARVRARFTLTLFSVAWGVLREAPLPRVWRTTVRAEFWRALRLAAAGSFGPVVVIAMLIGFGVVYQAVYWLGLAGQESLIGGILAVVVAREVAPVLVGLILLGRAGTVTTAELAQVSASGQLRALEAQGIDPFRLLVLPRAAAMAVAGFTLGIAFVIIALFFGHLVGLASGLTQLSAWAFGDKVLRALSTADFFILPGKLVAIGLLVALACAITGLEARPQEDVTALLPVAFARGALAILLTSALLSLAA